MNINKTVYKTILKKAFVVPFQIKFWDGEVVKYGEGQSEFTFIFNTPLAVSEIQKNPSMALGEAYMKNDIDLDGDLQKVIEYLYNNRKSLLHGPAKGKFLKNNNIIKSKDNVHHHYDIGNDFYELWLDDSMTYSCGYFQSPDDNLNNAQKSKNAYILKKLNLKKGQTLLDIGCGWGELILTAAKDYEVKCTGITLSKEQFLKVSERIRAEKLDDLVEIELLDYRELKNKSFDRVVSVGMVEHVGKDCLSEYFCTVNRLLNEEGVSLLHCITGFSGTAIDSWIDKYIFPGGYLPTVKELISYMANEKFHLIDAESLRAHYVKTLEHWANNFEKALPKIISTRDETFARMWRLYLNGCAASFNCGNIDVHQLLFTKGINNELPLTRDYLYQTN
ncbi:SAM-dependent methyltransferase [Acetobacterium bakii]|uniref:SAM-dependent methyltransferase n=1 Tax=Acetobacterium bakii TaxID=52689 RepID=A0A0L6TVX9_9FIRM|nr:cyclopropane-fatty-acyl-phospholipid synthase family protein [Acetobacterium bakii]KNZ40403.1 SAM-dependent methyltransferase [Acetobacterium bakii]